MQIDAKWIENLLMTMVLEKNNSQKEILHATQCFAIVFEGFSHLLNYQHLCMSWIIPFETIEIIIQMLHIAIINIYWNIHNNLMPHIYIWMSQWFFSHFLNFQNLHINWIIHF